MSLRRIAFFALVFSALPIAAAWSAQLSLSVQRPVEGQWQVFGLLSNNTDNDGLASLIVNITGTGDLGVATSTCQLPVGIHYWMVGQNVQSKYVGFTEFRSDGTYGIGIRAGQRTTALDQVVLTDVGYSAGSYPGDQTGQGLGPLQITWATPVLIASGTYSGTWGVFTAAIGDGQINVLNQNRDPNAVGQVHKIESVTSGAVQILHPGDAGGDNQVAFSDLSALATNWGQTNKTWADGDFNEDHTVNFPDLSILATNWGWSAPSPASVPEPASAAVLALGAVALLRRRKS
jgi:hypothetical protein